MSPAAHAGSPPGPRSESPGTAGLWCAVWEAGGGGAGRGGGIAVEIIIPEAGGRRLPAAADTEAAARSAPREESRPAVSGRNLALLPIAEVLSCQASGMVLLDGREPAEFMAGHVRGAVSIGLRGNF